MTALIALIGICGWLYVLELQRERDAARWNCEKWRRRACNGSGCEDNSGKGIIQNTLKGYDNL